jgi:hypothetical protein
MLLTAKAGWPDFLAIRRRSHEPVSATSLHARWRAPEGRIQDQFVFGPSLLYANIASINSLTPRIAIRRFML